MQISSQLLTKLMNAIGSFDVQLEHSQNLAGSAGVDSGNTGLDSFNDGVALHDEKSYRLAPDVDLKKTER